MNFFYYSVVLVNFSWWYTTFRKIIKGVRASLVTWRGLLFPSLSFLEIDASGTLTTHLSFSSELFHYLDSWGCFLEERKVYKSWKLKLDWLFECKLLELVTFLTILIIANIGRLLVVILFGASFLCFSFFFLEIVTDSFSTSSFPCETIIILF